ncbi:MAG: hypothetical protein JGK04_05800 [Microcoleus sp. PH2017_39_LGB_O_B]|uniref:hypothetical protein n=1 Tax=unclassified Microcoleus TaxID=2642155 RepID=UPI001D2B3511|nr:MULTISPECIES: hypothetical protein [unclassified Microcoleus]TAF89002.1 MAG: hypothetical protein EAZ49_14705 [Oscillatoriales cyanobacterium]MCC3447049.1 hypothetical protein [Microcoleus sp. PH2017_09_SFU_O_A]MCC3627960.1 hypothetical protein [Microcoleus sp. PH2017_39_LGB_O_B]MCC3640193.1 hypothetical protein [Microcoleus sp. PH2017_33_LGB_O_A]TAG69738.1 MAG: hypothetical protein EAZ23_25545 [Oscillatoriales cyanobacterium]
MGRNIDDIDQEIEHLMSLTENGGGFGDPDVKEAYDRKIQVLLSLRQQEIIKNKSESGQESQLSKLGVLEERITALAFFEGNISEWISDTCHLLTSIFGESHHSIKDISLILKSIEYDPPGELASDLYPQDEWVKVKERIVEILQICRRELEIMSAQFSQSPMASSTKSFGYVSATRIQELKSIKSKRVDLTKLIRLCEELNIAHANELNLATAMLLRAILDHVPPIFSKASFKEVASGYGGKSFKDTMQHLENGARKIADSHLHVQVRKKEVLPTSLQVNFSQYLDVLLAEVIAILQPEEA